MFNTKACVLSAKRGERGAGMTRKPNLKDKLFGCAAFTKDMIVGIFTSNVPRIQLDWFLICETIKGNFEIVDEEK